MHLRISLALLLALLGIGASIASIYAYVGRKEAADTTGDLVIRDLIAGKVHALARGGKRRGGGKAPRAAATPPAVFHR